MSDLIYGQGRQEQASSVISFILGKRTRLEGATGSNVHANGDGETAAKIACYEPRVRLLDGPISAIEVSITGWGKELSVYNSVKSRSCG